MPAEKNLSDPDSVVLFCKRFLFSHLNIHRMNKRFLTIVTLIFAAALLRLLPHAYNFSSIGALALFGGAYLNRKHLAYLVPVAALLFSDFFLGFYGLEMLVTYGAFALTVFIGTHLRNSARWYRVGAASLVSSFSFYLITNQIFFYPANHGALYPRTFTGMMESYVAGWPFFQNTLASDLVFSALMFGGFYLLTINIPSLQKESVKAS